MRIFSAPLSLLCFFWHLIVTIMTMINYVVHINNKYYRQPFAQAYLSFCIIGLTVYAFVSAPLFVYSYKYAPSVRSSVSKLMTGIAFIFGFFSLPILILHIIDSLQNNFSYTDIINLVIFMTSIISSLFGFVITWFAYMSVVARKLHRYLCYQRQITDAFSQEDHHLLGAVRLPRTNNDLPAI